MKRNIVIVGGELFNKGAQAMTFTVVDEIKRRTPEANIILLSHDDFTRRSEAEKNNYKFNFADGSAMNFLYAYNNFFKVVNMFKKINVNEANELKNILLETDVMIDISGYALSSDWGVKSSLKYLLRIQVAKKYCIPVHLLPQSFGPFNYSGYKKIITNFYTKKVLKYPETIFAREKAGYKLLKNKYNLKQVKLSPDIVLMNNRISIDNIYKNIPDAIELEVEHNSVAVLPNMRNFDHGNKEEILELYDEIIKFLITKKKTIYLIRHSVEDIEACKLIKKRFSENNKVILLPDEFSCFEYESIIHKFDFLVASRYHSIVHAYKENVPCIALGWATKYQELLSLVEQNEYLFDVRNNLDTEKILASIDKMSKSYNKQSEVINKKLDKISADNVFDGILTKV